MKRLITATILAAAAAACPAQDYDVRVQLEKAQAAAKAIDEAGMEKARQADAKAQRERQEVYSEPPLDFKRAAGALVIAAALAAAVWSRLAARRKRPDNV